MKPFILLLFVVGGLWDGLTTTLGIALITGATAKNYTAIGMCVVGGLLVLGFGLSFRAIIEWDGFWRVFLLLLFIIALAFDGYTSFVGTARYVVLHQSITDFRSTSIVLTNGQWFVVGVVTILVTCCPMSTSLLFSDGW